MKNKAFTLAEMLITMTIIGIVASITMSVLKVNPNNNAALFRKAYNHTTKVIYDIMQSNAYYREGSFRDTDATFVPIDNGTKPSGASKFCELFADAFNVSNGVNCNSSGTFTSPTFITQDGIWWGIPVSNFAGAENIYIDVNGNKPPNCEPSSCEYPDRFTITVMPSGKISINNQKAREYLQDSRNIIKK